MRLQWANRCFTKSPFSRYFKLLAWVRCWTSSQVLHSLSTNRILWLTELSLQSPRSISKVPYNSTKILQINFYGTPTLYTRIKERIISTWSQHMMALASSSQICRGLWRQTQCSSLVWDRTSSSPTCTARCSQGSNKCRSMSSAILLKSSSKWAKSANWSC